MRDSGQLDYRLAPSLTSLEPQGLNLASNSSLAKQTEVGPGSVPQSFQLG